MQNLTKIKKLLIASKTDPSGFSIYEHLKSTYPWKSIDDVLIHGNIALHLQDEPLLFRDFPESEFENRFIVENIIFLSRHSSARDISSITVHPMGNFSTADLGGAVGKFSITSPELMSNSLRIIKENYHGSKFLVTLEATHHGPISNIPSFFAEIGTTPEDWSDKAALEALSHAVMESNANDYPNYIGVGGGHYSPKITSYILENKVNIGHIISKHRHNELTMKILVDAAMKTPKLRGFIIDKKGSKATALNLVKELSKNKGYENIIL